MTRLPIRWQFTLWYGATLALLLFGFSLLLFFLMGRQLLARTDRQLEEELRELTLEVRLAQNVPELLEQTQRRFAEHGVYDFQITSPQGAVLFESHSLIRRPPLKSVMPADVGSQLFDTREVEGVGLARVATSLANGPDGPYVLQALTSLRPLEQEMGLLSALLLATGPIALASGLLAGYTLARRALSPVDRMVEVANRITGTDLQQRIEISNPNDEMGRLAQTLNALIDRLQRVIEEMRRFTADAAHELRTPLAVLRSEVEIALRAPRTAEEYRRALEVVAEEAHRLTRLADQMLFLSRHEAGMLKLEGEEVRLDALIKDVVDQLASRAKEKEIQLDMAPLPRWILSGDDIRLSQAFYNILDNAIKFSPFGSRVTLRGREFDGRVKIEIEDDGPGIPPEHLPHVFDRFYRVEQSRNRDRGGAGLGLAIALAAVTSHGGTIRIANAQDHGLIVTVELPTLATPRGEGDIPAEVSCAKD
jgi:heavy metal sensor kinase